MDIQQNTEFVLGKIDSLMQGAMPYLEKGAEEVIRYKVIEFQIQHVMFCLFSLFCWVVFIIGYKLLKKDSHGEEGFFVCLAGGIAGAGSLFVAMDNTAGFVLSFTSPELFAIMQLIGK